MHGSRHSRFRITAAGLLCALAPAFAPLARAGGTPEHALIIIDPKRPDANYIGNYYRAVRNVPASNVLYMDPGAPNFATFVSRNLDALFGELESRGIEDHVDYILVAPSDSFFVSAQGLVSDTCSPVNRFSMSGVYTMAFVANEVLGGTFDSGETNRYYRSSPATYYFDSSLAYYRGQPDTVPDARRYFIGCSLGYTGERGNTVQDLVTMIDRSAAADGTHPAGTFYFMETTDVARSGPRDSFYPTAVQLITNDGGMAEHMMAVLPTPRFDVLGIMTGWATPSIDQANMTILPGAFCDHLTSWAATFDVSSQIKMSRWIAKGASGTWGTVEEPCNYPGKFPHARLHVYYFRGASLGEAALRSAGFTPFQGLLYGDPLTRPFTHIPAVDVADAPTGPVSGVIQLTPSATTTLPGASILSFELLIDGVLHSTALPGTQFTVNTADLSDGWHDLRVLAYDDTVNRATGRFVGDLVVNNRGRSAGVTPMTTSGDLATPLHFDLTSTEGGAAELRLVQNGRVVAAAAGGSASLDVFGLTLGAGRPIVQAEALFADGERVRSAPLELDITFANGTPVGAAPVAFSYTKKLTPGTPALVELPAAFDDAGVTLSYEVVSSPAQATVEPGSTSAFRLVRPDASATGSDTMTFRTTGGPGPSNVATITLVYSSCVGDLDGNGIIELADLTIVLANFGTLSGATYEQGDLDGDGDVDLADLSMILAIFGSSC